MPGEADVDDDDDQDQRHHQEGERRRLRVVALVQVERLDHVADHRLLGAAEQLRVDVVAEGRDEGEQDAGDDPRHGQRQRHLEEGLSRGGVEVLGGLDQAQVEPLQVGVDRQDHEGQEVVGEAGDHRPRGGEDPAVLGTSESVCRTSTTGLESLRIVFQAIVRIR